MNILWIVNILFPEAEMLLSGKGDLKSSGGWLLGLSNAIVEKTDNKLHVASVTKRVNKLTVLQGNHITYFLLPSNGYSKYWQTVRKQASPDVVHIHGTEYPWGASYVDQCGGGNVVVSIQGLLSAYYYYYYYGLSTFEIIKNFTIGDLLFGGPIRGKMSFKKESKREVNLLQKVSHIIGRTSWDRARTWAINPNSKYYTCNEILRDDFYEGDTWSYDKCTPHTIFLSQAFYPIKGIHQLLKAMPLVLRHFPDTIIYVAGTDMTSKKGLRSKLLFNSYSKIVCRLIDKFGLKEHVKFIGPQNATEMKKAYLKCNVFISPSTIENSPNSLGEAQILGVPCISSYVGGVADMIPNKNCGIMYRFEEVEMLANAICQVFENQSFDGQTEMISVAKRRHSINNIIRDIKDIYICVSNNI